MSDFKHGAYGYIQGDIGGTIEIPNGVDVKITFEKIEGGYRMIVTSAGETQSITLHDADASEAEAARAGAEAAQTAAEAAQAAAEDAQSAAENAQDKAEYAQAAAEGVIPDVQAEGQAQIEAIDTEGQAQIAAIGAEGERVLETIPEDYSELSGDVSSLKTQMSELSTDQYQDVHNGLCVSAFDYTYSAGNISVSSGTISFNSSTDYQHTSYIDVDGVDRYNRFLYVPVGYKCMVRTFDKNDGTYTSTNNSNWYTAGTYELNSSTALRYWVAVVVTDTNPLQTITSDMAANTKIYRYVPTKNSSDISALKSELNDCESSVNRLFVEYPLVNYYEPEDSEDIIDSEILHNGVPQSQYGSSYFVSDYVPVTGGKTITFNVTPWGAASDSYRGAEYKSDKTYIGRIDSTTHTLNSNAAYVRFSVRRDSFGDTTAQALAYINANLTITDGTRATEISGIDATDNVFLSEGTARKEDTYFVDASGTEMLILWKMYGLNNKDVGIKLKTFSKNDLYQFCSFGTVANPSNYVSNESDNYVEFISTAEDWFSPIRVKAVNDIDGDSPLEDKFSGGLHTYSDQNTARRISLDIYFDGRKNPGYVGYCKTIDVIEVHQLVASNTFKNNGTGREVIVQTIKMHFEGGTVHVQTEYKALEPVTVSRWYFLQAHHKADGFGTAGIRYIGSDANRGINDMDAASNSGDMYARTMRLLSSDMQIDMEIDDFDIGRFSHSTEYSAFVSFYTSYSKAYFRAIYADETPFSLDTGDTFMARGYYRFGMFEQVI